MRMKLQQVQKWIQLETGEATACSQTLEQYPGNSASMQMTAALLLHWMANQRKNNSSENQRNYERECYQYGERDRDTQSERDVNLLYL